MNLLDLVLLLAVLAFAVSGYQRGLVAGLVSLAGFVGGAIIGVWLLPFVMELVDRGSPAATLVAVLTVLLPALAGQGLAARLAWRLRSALSWTPVRWADGVGGAVVNALAVLVVGWVGASALAATPSPSLNQEIRGSTLLSAVDERMPDSAASWFNQASEALSGAGFPQVFNPFENEPGAEVAEPSGDAVTPAVRSAAQRSTVKVEGVAEVDGGRRGKEGSGFVYSAGHVMTNAHVVAGVDDPTVRVGGVGRPHPAKVVLFDPDKDVAVLDVPGLSAPALSFDRSARRGSPAVVAGYPENGGLDLRAATVAQRVTAHGQDIYGSSGTTRDIYALRSTVRPGNSGGPLLTTDGRVYGVIFARSTSDASTGYALTAEQVREHARRGVQASAPVDTGSGDTR
ncbi:MarP family serine protease [Streptomyces sp. AJS327]|uniref:MarP family serine protease n=1 Tax=Streptomyces sp. AJS327 TaxID=2545265 RepID=UPI0015DEE0D2|nr:MarP family serine protease [Streptomyces sp. AJS327]MBA0050582.1 MarP family serine protease [Streptomyces sp. AJS327]